MKRLVLLVLVLAPFALWELSRLDHESGPRHMLRPRTGRASHRVSAPDATKPYETEVVGYPMATPERARREAERRLKTVLADWLEKTGLPRTWTPPRPLLEPLVQPHEVESIDKDYGTVYVQALTLRISADQRDRLVMAYERELAGRRLVRLGEVLAFILVCLALLAGYIHTDEATRGYYTNYLRVAALAGVGLAGAALIKILS